MYDTAKQMVLGADMLPRTIRLIPNLSIAALRRGLDKELAMWYCLRAINFWGSGRLELEMAVNALMHWFHYSKSTAYRILDGCDGIFWDKEPIYGLKKVIRYFDVGCGRYFLEISPQDFVGDGKTRVSRQRAWLYSSFYKPQGTKTLPISRASIQAATSVKIRSQQRYDGVAVRRVPNFADKQDTNGKMIPIIELVDGKSRQWPVHKRLGNTYYCKAQRSAAGMLRKVNAAVGQSFERGEACHLQRFFMTARSYIKCRQRHEDPYIIVPAADSWITGGMEWCRVNP